MALKTKPPLVYRFSNKTYIYNKNRKLILPTSTEGQKIEKILKLQKANHKLNAEQKKLYYSLISARNWQEAIRFLFLFNKKDKKKEKKRHPTPPATYKFSTGNYIFRKDRVIDPKSPEGKKIEELFTLQREGVILNSIQRKKWENLTRIPNMDDAIAYLLRVNKRR